MINFHHYLETVSYTHLDVYKRQRTYTLAVSQMFKLCLSPVCMCAAWSARSNILNAR